MIEIYGDLSLRDQDCMNAVIPSRFAGENQMVVSWIVCAVDRNLQNRGRKRCFVYCETEIVASVPPNPKQGAQQSGHKGKISTNLPSATILVLHLSGWRDAQRWAAGAACARINNGNCIASSLSHWLMQLHLVLLRRVVVLE